MPELPEVETVRTTLTPFILNKTLTDVQLSDKALRYTLSAKQWQQLIGKKFLNIRRRGKYLLFDLTNNTVLLAHLGMTGKFYLATKNTSLKLHDHVVLQFAQEQLHFNDVRRFGFFAAFSKEDEQKHPRLKHLGLEPLSEEFSAKALQNLTQKTTKPIKNLLMDNKALVGVGNIYANEALFMANIHPLKPANELSLAQCSLLQQAIINILKAAIKQGGTTIKDFKNADGKTGYFSVNLNVYDQKHCKKCHTLISRVTLAGRSTFFCEKCQKN